jgi:ABC-type sugar transport system permease subunit
MPEETKIAELLEKNNALLEKLVDFEKKRQHGERNARIMQAIVIILPYILIAVAVFLMWQWMAHYMDLMNNNINALKSNFDALREFLQKLVPDFGAIGDKLQETWNEVSFWN